MTEELYSYLFHYNHHTGLWSAIPREKHDEYWNDAKSKGILRSKSIGTLITLINKGDDFIKKVKK